MNVSLSDYDYVTLNTSGGKDSQTTLRQIVTQADREGYPRNRIICCHADLGRMEWPGTKELAQAQAEHYGLSLRTVVRAQDLLAHIEQRGKFPSSDCRYCTSDHKRDQIAKIFTALVAELDQEREGKVRILNVMGMRAQESPARAKLAPFVVNKRFTNGKRHIDNWLPIHAWDVRDVWNDIKQSGVPYHNAYDLGMPRLSCMFCIFSPPAALMIAGRNNPELLADYVAVEKRTGHNFRKDFPISTVQAAIVAGEDWGKATDWVM